MYGISGACARHPCLWCHIPSDMLCVPLAERLNQFSLRSLITLKSDYDKFVNNHHCDVIDDVFFDIPLDHVYLPGLHITLGIFLKLFRAFENIDIKIAKDMANGNHNDNDFELSM